MSDQAGIISVLLISKGATLPGCESARGVPLSAATELALVIVSGSLGNKLKAVDGRSAALWSFTSVCLFNALPSPPSSTTRLLLLPVATGMRTTSGVLFSTTAFDPGLVL